MTTQSAYEFSRMLHPPIPYSLPPGTAKFPCDGKGLIIFHSPISEAYNNSQARQDLSGRYLTRNIQLDWRIHIATSDITKHLSTFDSEG